MGRHVEGNMKRMHIVGYNEWVCKVAEERSNSGYHILLVRQTQMSSTIAFVTIVTAG